MSSFSQLNLDPDIYKAIAACGYTTPTPIQAKSIPDILEGKDLVASAQTGSGKTAAFVLPALHRLSSQKTASKKTRILILTPTRELAMQVMKAASTYGKFLRFNIVSLVGGMPYHHQIKDLARGADIIVATPGRLMDHMDQKRVDLSHVEMLVLDEADRMLDMGFIDDVEYIAKLTPKDRQTLLFSATVDKKLTQVVRHLLKNPVRIDLSHEKISAPDIKQEMYRVNNLQHKSSLLKHLLSEEPIYKAIIFSATKINADKVAKDLQHHGFKAAALHGDLRQNVRNRTLEQLRQGRIQFLVATDVAARGLDVSDITHVINYDLPRFSEDYVHRIGRTGRAGKAGIAISFVSPTDMQHLKRIERYLGHQFKLKSASQINQEKIDSLRVEFVPEKHTGKKSYHDSAPKKFSRKKGDGERKHFSDEKEGHGEKKKFHREKEAYGKRKFSSHKENDGDRKPYGEKKKFSDEKEAYGERKKFRGEKKAFGDKSRFKDRDDKESHGERKKFSGEKKAYGDRNRFRDDKEPHGERKRFRDDKEPFGERKRFRGDKEPGEKKRFRDDREPFGERKRFRDDKEPHGEKKRFRDDKEPFGERKRFRDDKESHGERKKFSGEKKAFGERKRFSDEKKPDGERKKSSDDKDPFGKRKKFSGEKKAYGERKKFSGKKPWQKQKDR